MKKRWTAILLAIVLGTLPAIALVSQPTESVDVPVIVAWDDFVAREYDNEYIPDWRMYIDFQLQVGSEPVIEQSIATGVKPFSESGRAETIGPFTVTWPVNFAGTGRVYGRVRWYVEGGVSPDKPVVPSIAGNWVYIQDVTSPITVLYFPLALKASD